MADTVADWVALVHDRYPPEHAADWDSVGLQVGDPRWPVEHVLVTLDVTTAVVAEATSLAPVLILAHHPLLFRPLARLTPATAAGKVALAAARGGIAVLAAHTNLDVTRDGAGTSEPIMRTLGVTSAEPLEPLASAAEVGFGLVSDLPEPLTLRDLATRIRDRLPAPHLRYAGEPDRRVRRVAAVGGAGESLIPAASAAGADVLVTGDLRHHAVLDALELGLALVDAGHHATEAAALQAWIERLRAASAARGLVADLLASQISTAPWSS
ncbi:MAG: Nif3-like dinuclear metal center hexameric protein [Actinomycetota bacterium]|nr:Nif3-like dinuclear metal center hexameric protein [Actinomycetota bacterium]